MAFDIAQFKTAGLEFGGARPSLFEVIFVPPAAAGINPAAAAKFTFTCKATELPESTVSNIEIPYFGRRIKVAGERNFADWSVTIMNDEDFAVRAMMEAWSNAINRMVQNIRDPAFANEGYKCDFLIIQYSKDGLPIRSYDIIGAFPTQISGVTLGWDSQNAIEEFTVNFAYDYWLPQQEVPANKNPGLTSPYRNSAE